MSEKKQKGKEYEFIRTCSFGTIKEAMRKKKLLNSSMTADRIECQGCKEMSNIFNKNMKSAIAVGGTIVGMNKKIGMKIKIDKNNGSSRNTIRKVAIAVGKNAGAVKGAAVGSTIGSAISPGAGTYIGGILGGMIGRVAGKKAADSVAEAVFEKTNYDIDYLHCERCGKHFECRRFQEGSQKKCKNCRFS